MKNKKGFTLIEIIAVIVILGVVMLIAVPSVTHQILLSKKGAYATNVKSFLETADGSYRQLEFGEYLEEKELIIAPLDSLKMDVEDLQKSPFGAYDKSRSYIVIKPTKNNFKSYAIIRDAANYGIDTLSYDDINKNSVKTTSSDSIQSLSSFYTCASGEVALNVNKPFNFLGKEYYATDYELPNSDKCDANNTPVIKFSSVELENGDIYTINYDPTTGEGEMESTECSFGLDCTLRANAFTKLGYHFTKWTKVKSGRGITYTDKQVANECLSMFSACTLDIDENGDGEIDFEDFVTLMEKQTQVVEETDEELVLRAFKSFDKDNDGKITNYEFKYILTQMGKKFSEDEVNQLFKECNLDINGILVYQDFINFWKKH